LSETSTERTLLYTASLSGQIELLPRLYTFLRALRSEFQPALAIDLGSACTPDVWHCADTDGRSMLIVLDGMGYTAVNASALATDDQERVRGQSVMALVDAEHPHVEHDFLFALTPTRGDGHLCVVMKPATATSLEGDVLRLQAVSGAEIGVARVTMTTDGISLLSAETRLLPTGTAPDATIAGVVDFVLAEARYYGKRKSGDR
jgi:hypothetical protein